MAATYLSSSAVYNGNTVAVTGTTGDTIYALAWDSTITGGGWTLRVDDSAGSGWRIYTKTHAGETGNYTFSGGVTYPTVFVLAFSGASETNYGTPSFTSGTDTNADNSGASGSGVAVGAVLSFGPIGAGQAGFSGGTQRQIDPSQAAALYTKAVSGSSGAFNVTDGAPDYDTVVLVVADAGGPSISAQPASTQVKVGATASFSVTASASGGGSLSYQWKLNGTNVSTGSGGTTSSYTTAALALSDDQGSYTCDVTETGGSSPGTATSAAALAYVGIRKVGTTTAVYGTTALTPAYVAGVAAGGDDLWVLDVIQKPSSANGGTLTNPTGFERRGERSGATDGDTGGYTTTLGADTGNCNAWTLTKVATGSETGTLSVSLGTSNAAGAKLTLYRKPAGTAWRFGTTTGKDTAAGNISITGDADPGVLAGDHLRILFAQPTDVTTPAQFSAEAFTQTGVTFGTATEDEELDTTTGNDLGGLVSSVVATAGTSSAAPVFTATAGGTTTNVRGPGVFLRLRAETVQLTAGSYSLTGTSINATYTPGGGGGTQTTVQPTAGSYAITGAGPTALVTRRAQCTAGSYALTGATIAVRVTRRVTLTAGSYAVTGPGIVLEFAKSGTSGTYTITGSTLGVSVTRRAALTAGSYTLTGSTCNALKVKRATCTAGSYALTGVGPTMLVTRRAGLTAGSYAVTGTSINANASGGPLTAQCTAGSYAVTGTGLGVTVIRRATLTAGSYALTGAGPTALVTRRAALTAGSYAATGVGPAARATRRAALTPGSLALTGAGPTPLVIRRTALATGTYAVTGSGVEATPSQGLAPVQPTAGAYTLTGTPLVVRVNRRAALTAGSYSLASGVLPVALQRRATLTAGSYVATSSGITVRATWRAALAAGVLAVVGNSIGASHRRTVALLPGSYVTVGVDLERRASLSAVLASGVYSLTGHGPNAAASNAVQLYNVGATFALEVTPTAIVRLADNE